MSVKYDIWFRVGESGGPFRPKDGNPITSLVRAEAIAKTFLPKVDEVVITELKVVRRLKGSRPKEGGRVLPFDEGASGDVGETPQ